MFHSSADSFRKDSKEVTEIKVASSEPDERTSLLLNFEQQFSTDIKKADNEVDVMCEKVRTTTLPEIEIKGDLKRYPLRKVLNTVLQNRNISTWYINRCSLEHTNEYGIDVFYDEVTSASKKCPKLILKWRFFPCDWNRPLLFPSDRDRLLRRPDPFIDLDKSSLALTKNNRRLHLTDAYLSDGFMTGSNFNFAKEHFEYVTLFNCVIENSGFLRLPKSVTILEADILHIELSNLLHIVDYIAKCINLKVIKFRNIVIFSNDNCRIFSSAPSYEQHLKLFKQFIQKLGVMLINHPGIQFFSLNCDDPNFQSIVDEEAVIYKQRMADKMHTMTKRIRSLRLFGGVRVLDEMVFEYLDERPNFFAQLM